MSLRINIHQSTLLSSLVLDACLLDSLTVIDPLSSKVLECELFNYWRKTTDLTVSLIVRLDYGSLKKKITHWKLVFIDSHIVSLRQAQGPEEMCLSKTRRKPLKKWVILIALRFRYTFYIPQTKRLRVRKVGLQCKIQTSCLGRPSGDVLCASEAMACGYWFSKWLTTKSIWVR